MPRSLGFRPRTQSFPRANISESCMLNRVAIWVQAMQFRVEKPGKSKSMQNAMGRATSFGRNCQTYVTTDAELMEHLDTMMRDCMIQKESGLLAYFPAPR